MSTSSSHRLPFATNLVSLTNWLSELPPSGRERYALLYSGLESLNTVKPELAFYFKALEKIRPLAMQISGSLTALILGKPLPLEFGVRKLAKLSAQFHVELAQGYTSIAHHQNFGKVFGMDLQGRVILCALRSCGQVLLRSALMYEAPSSTFWRRIHEIYALAERYKLLQNIDPTPEFSHSKSVTVEDLYRSLLAFRLANPYRLNQIEIQEVFNLLQQHGKLIGLGSCAIEAEHRVDFCFDLGGLGGPVSFFNADDKNPNLRYLSLGPLRKAFQAMAHPKTQGEDFEIPPKLAAYLDVRWGGRLEFPLERKFLSSRLIAGHKNLVGVITQVEAKIDAGESFSEFNLLSLDEHILPISRIETSKTSGTFSADAASQKRAMRGLESLEHAKNGMTCKLFPSQTLGFFLIVADGLELDTEGLVGVFTENKVIQFGRLFSAGLGSPKYTYGFELLASQVGLVNISMKASPRKTIFSFFSSSGDGRCSLITPSLRLRGGDELNIARHGKSGSFVVARLLAQTDEFSQFEIVPKNFPG